MFGNMGDIMKQVQEMQAKMARIQEELKEKTVEVSTGGGMVTAVVNGRQEVIRLRIEKEVIDPEEAEMLEDLVVAAVNQGLKKAGEMMQAEIQNAAGGLDIQSLLGGFGLGG